MNTFVKTFSTVVVLFASSVGIAQSDVSDDAEELKITALADALLPYRQTILSSEQMPESLLAALHLRFPSAARRPGGFTDP